MKCWLQTKCLSLLKDTFCQVQHNTSDPEHLMHVCCCADGASTSSARPDLTYVNDESVAPRAPLEGAAPQQQQQQQQQPQRSTSGAPAWADVDL